MQFAPEFRGIYSVALPAACIRAASLRSHSHSNDSTHASIHRGLCRRSRIEHDIDIALTVKGQKMQFDRRTISARHRSNSTRGGDAALGHGRKRVQSTAGCVADIPGRDPTGNREPRRQNPSLGTGPCGSTEWFKSLGSEWTEMAKLSLCAIRNTGRSFFTSNGRTVRRPLIEVTSRISTRDRAVDFLQPGNAAALWRRPPKYTGGTAH